MLTAYYDLSLSPPTYDFVSFLLHAECERRRLGHEQCEIAFLPGPVGGFRRDRLWPFTVEERQALSENLVRPMCSLLPSCTGWRIGERIKQWTPSIGYGQRIYGLGVFVDAMTQCGPTLWAPQTTFDPKLVTITLRECQHWPERNSNVGEWIKAAIEIEKLGFRVVMVRDTLKAGEEIDGLTCDHWAPYDLIARAGLYASAACNFFVSSGPAWLAVALGAPALIFRPANDKSDNPAARSAHLAVSGIPRGGQCPGTLPTQRLVWEPDDCDNIVQAFDRRMQ